MKTLSSLFSVLVAIAVASSLVSTGLAAAFTPGDLVVLQVGDGSSTLVNTGGPISLLEYNPTGALQQTITVPSGNGGLQVSGSASSEGSLTLSADRTSLALAGYIPPFTGTGSSANRTDAEAPRGYTTVSSSGTVATPTAIAAYSGNNIRGAVTSATGVYFAGGTTGTIYCSGNTNTTIQSLSTGLRVTNIQNGDLFYSTTSTSNGSSIGIFRINGTPTTAVTPTAFITGVTGQGTNPYDFALSPTGTVAYIADGTLGIQKFTLSGGVWSLAYNITSTANGLTGLAVNFSGANPVL